MLKFHSAIKSIILAEKIPLKTEQQKTHKGGVHS